MLFEIFKDRFNIEIQAQMIDEVYNKNFNIAGFAESVIEAAAKGDDLSNIVLYEESDELLIYIQVRNWFSDFTIKSSLLKEDLGELIIKPKSENQFVFSIYLKQSLLIFKHIVYDY